jgi:hypothetical protein
MTGIANRPQPDTDWEQRVAALWTAIDEHDPADFRARIDEAVAELPPDSAIGMFERACAFDSTGHSDQAAPLYRAALDTGLTGIRRRRAVIQMSSSLRNIGRAAEGVALLTAERERGTDELSDAVSATLALCLVDVGREREAVSIALAALAPHLARYQRSMGNYARLLIEPDEDEA